MDETESQRLGNIYTIGHSNHPMEKFLELLKANQIEVLIDTRSSPFSRYSPQFNRDSLKAAVQAEGIKYGFYGRELGGRPEEKESYDAQGNVLYAEVAKSLLFQDGLARLMQGASRCRVALLCSEENPCVCHRHLLISRILDGLGVHVAHIRGDGRLETERELQENAAELAAERQARLDEKQQAAERELQAKAAQQAAKRERREEAEQLKQQAKLETAAARLKKKQERLLKAEQERAERKMKISRNPRKAAQPLLFDMEET